MSKGKAPKKSAVIDRFSVQVSRDGTVKYANRIYWAAPLVAFRREWVTLKKPRRDDNFAVVILPCGKELRCQMIADAGFLDSEAARATAHEQREERSPRKSVFEALGHLSHPIEQRAKVSRFRITPVVIGISAVLLCQVYRLGRNAGLRGQGGRDE